MLGSREAPCELSGMAVALHAVHVELGDSPAGAAARRALGRVRSRFDVQRWGVTFELPGGDAGIALGALEADDPGLAGRTILLRGPGALESSWCTPTGPAPSPPPPPVDYLRAHPRDRLLVPLRCRGCMRHLEEPRVHGNRSAPRAASGRGCVGGGTGRILPDPSA